MRLCLPSLVLVWVLLVGVLTNVLSQETCQGDGNGVCSNNQQEEATAGTHQTVKIAKGANAMGAPPPATLKQCADRYEVCADYAARGECENNPGWMIISCPQSCNACHLLDPKVRCNRQHLNISDDPILHPGDLERMFRTINDRVGHKYDIEVHSDSPWVVVFHNFLTDDETEAFISTVDGGWERSTDSGQSNELGETGRTISKSRTSSNAWCRASCENHPSVQSAIRKIEEVTNIPYSHSESFQILQYEPGQFYRVHHDMSPRQNGLSCGPRILTFFLYLSDVEEGGETNFPRLGIKVKPRKGSALLWPSIMDHNPMEQDARTHHEAMPVIKGQKYASNSWIHLYDFQKSNLWGCTGSFDYI